MTSDAKQSTIDHEEAVRERYSGGAQVCETSLCCPVSYDAKYPEVLPDEILERDYGCGDPTPYVKEGDTVVDLGSGGGKACWIAAQIAGPNGRVIGVDMNTEMLGLAREHHDSIAQKVGFDTVSYHRGMIQDLKLDFDLLEEQLRAHPIDNAASWLELRGIEDRLRGEQPMIADESVDVILSNCVLNLVRPEDKAQLFDEMYRVLKNDGRVAISDIVCDEDVPLDMQNDPTLWSGCISGAYREDLFLKAFTDAGFHGVELVHREEEPWQTVNGIEFRSVTVQAFKGKAGPCLERHQAVVYRGPFSKVFDDDGHVFVRGERMAVCDKTRNLLMREPFAGQFFAVDPRVEVPMDEATNFDCAPSGRRDPRVTKGQDFDLTTEPGSSCGPDSTGCC
ncbi:MAG: methyltransferase domain-containing protein [Planctomycetota bacterium]